MTFKGFLKIKKGIDTDGRNVFEFMDEYYDEYDEPARRAQPDLVSITSGGMTPSGQRSCAPPRLGVGRSSPVRISRRSSGSTHGPRQSGRHDGWRAPRRCGP